jgi:hypothetical protein
MVIFFSLIMAFSIKQNQTGNTGAGIRGAWMLNDEETEVMLLFIDNYFTQTKYSKANRKFIYTTGGKYTIKNDKLEIEYEFDTRDKEMIGQVKTYPISIKEDKLSIAWTKDMDKYKKIDNGSAPLAGVWHITSRMQDDKLVPIHRTGTRKTIKILSGNRFQWAAIDPGTKQFSGTGGGTYSFSDGKYSEHIEFFSRDSSRVGAVLTFDGKIENGDWHHSGKSSKGDPIYEVWSKIK